MEAFNENQIRHSFPGHPVELIEPLNSIFKVLLWKWKGSTTKCFHPKKETIINY